MHRCLAVPEIFSEILKDILPSDEPRLNGTLTSDACHLSLEGRPVVESSEELYQTLLALACTCKRFLEPSLDALWRTVDSFWPIFVALGISERDLEEMITRHRNPYYPRRNPYHPHLSDLSEAQFKELALRLIIDADYNKAQYYLSRIRIFKLHAIPSALLWAVGELSRKWGSPLLPNVRELHLTPPLTKDYLIFCGRRLVHVSAPLSADSPSLTTHSYPNFDSIYIPADNTKDTNDVVSSFIKNLPPMRVIDAVGCNSMPGTLEVIAAMSSLRSLSIGKFPDLSSSPAFLSPGRLLPCLQELLIGDIDLDLCTQLLYALEDPSALRQLHVGYLSTTGATLQKFMTTVATRCSPICLTRFTVSSNGPRRSADAELPYSSKIQPIAVQPAALQPLLPFVNLEYLNINVFTFNYDDGFVESIALACPNIVTLCLNEHPEYIKSRNLTLRCLYPLAKYCPRLESLNMGGFTFATGPGKIGVDGLSRTWTHDERYDVVPGLSLHFLNSSQVGVIDRCLVDIAAYLMDIFPKIRYVDYHPLYFHIRDVREPGWNDWK
ncbi:hypothetical protein DENSPDRAFT_843117 [Dentipellis sp. KUC8613]|nr:hypothetical protein DENSPDRAFT_843117 [Dentipellis sp. KUC8613]